MPTKEHSQTLKLSVKSSKFWLDKFVYFDNFKNQNTSNELVEEITNNDLISKLKIKIVNTCDFRELALVINESLCIFTFTMTSWFVFDFKKEYVIIPTKEIKFDSIKSRFNANMSMENIMNYFHEHNQKNSNSEDKYRLFYNIILANGMKLSFEITLDALYKYNIYLKDGLFFDVIDWKIKPTNEISWMDIQKYKYKDELIQEISSFEKYKNNLGFLDENITYVLKSANKYDFDINDRVSSRYKLEILFRNTYYDEFYGRFCAHENNDEYNDLNKYNEDEVSQSEFEESLTQMAAELFASAQAMNIPVEKMRDHFVKSYDDFIANSPSPKLGKEAFEYFMSIIDQLIEKVTPDERNKINYKANDNKHEDDSDDNPIN